jgi:hypothetical protein
MLVNRSFQLSLAPNDVKNLLRNEVFENFCDEKLCEFYGEAKPRKHVACLKNNVRFTTNKFEKQIEMFLLRASNLFAHQTQT